MHWTSPSTCVHETAPLCTYCGDAAVGSHDGDVLCLDCLAELQQDSTSDSGQSSVPDPATSTPTTDAGMWIAAQSPQCTSPTPCVVCHCNVLCHPEATSILCSQCMWAHWAFLFDATQRPYSSAMEAMTTCEQCGTTDYIEGFRITDGCLCCLTCAVHANVDDEVGDEDLEPSCDLCYELLSVCGPLRRQADLLCLLCATCEGTMQ